MKEKLTIETLPKPLLDEAASGDAEHLVDTLMAVADLRM